MEYKSLGKSGLQVSRICVGMMAFGEHPNRSWAVGEEGALAVVRAAVDCGVNFFDTADMYGEGLSEEITGSVLKQVLSRDETVLATKVYSQMTPGPNGRGLSRKHILSAIDASLRRLGVDYVDLYQIHRWDPDVPIEETMEALHHVVVAGKARYLGASSMYAWQFAKAQHVATANGWTQFISMQNHYNLIYREEEREMIPLCQDQRVGLIPWSPLGRGLLAGNRTRVDGPRTLRAKTDEFAAQLYTHPGDLDIAERVESVAATREVSMARIALAWLLSKPAVTAPIVGATRPEHIGEAAGALDLHLEATEVEHLEELYSPRPVLGHR